MSKRVLLVDDNDGIRAVLRMSFELTGQFEVVGQAANGAEAIEQVEKTAADVLVLDLGMPVMDGLEALPHLRERLPNGKIIIYTASYDPEMRASAFAGGADAYLEKVSIPADVVKTALELTGNGSENGSNNHD